MTASTKRYVKIHFVGFDSFRIIRELRCVEVDISMCLKLNQMYRYFFELGGPRTRFGFTGTSRNRRSNVPFSVFYLLTSLVVSLLL